MTDARSLASVVTVPPTPFREDGSLDIAAFEAVLRRTTDAGIHAITVAGHTGEFAALAPDEITEFDPAERAGVATILESWAVRAQVAVA